MFVKLVVTSMVSFCVSSAANLKVSVSCDSEVKCFGSEYSVEVSTDRTYENGIRALNLSESCQMSPIYPSEMFSGISYTGLLLGFKTGYDPKPGIHVEYFKMIIDSKITSCLMKYETKK